MLTYIRTFLAYTLVPESVRVNGPVAADAAPGSAVSFGGGVDKVEVVIGVIGKLRAMLCAVLIKVG